MSTLRSFLDCWTRHSGLCLLVAYKLLFTVANMQDPKNMLLQAARNGSCEGMEGLVTAAVCGKMAPFGTGADFELQWQDQVMVKQLGGSAFCLIFWF